MSVASISDLVELRRRTPAAKELSLCWASVAIAQRVAARCRRGNFEYFEEYIEFCDKAAQQTRCNWTERHVHRSAKDGFFRVADHYFNQWDIEKTEAIMNYIDESDPFKETRKCFKHDELREIREWANESQFKSVCLMFALTLEKQVDQIENDDEKTKQALVELDEIVGSNATANMGSETKCDDNTENRDDKQPEHRGEEHATHRIGPNPRANAEKESEHKGNERHSQLAQESIDLACMVVDELSQIECLKAIHLEIDAETCGLEGIQQVALELSKLFTTNIPKVVLRVTDFKSKRTHTWLGALEALLIDLRKRFPRRKDRFQLEKYGRLMRFSSSVTNAMAAALRR